MKTTLLQSKIATKFLTMFFLFTVATPSKSQETASSVYDEFQQSNSYDMQNLISFSAQFINGKAYLNWSVSDTCGKCVYYVERSDNGILFETISVKTGLPSPGNFKLGYSFTDNNPKIIYSFYRIKRIDESGVVTTSWIEIIYNDSSLQTISNDFEKNLLVIEK